jgi:hypothetical protein
MHSSSDLSILSLETLCIFSREVVRVGNNAHRLDVGSSDLLTPSA